MLDGVVMAMILVITVITQDWHKLDEDKFDADGSADNKELEATQDTIPPTKCIIWSQSPVWHSWCQRRSLLRLINAAF